MPCDSNTGIGEDGVVYWEYAKDQIRLVTGPKSDSQLLQMEITIGRSRPRLLIYYSFFFSHSIKSSFNLPCSANSNLSYTITTSIYFLGAFFGVWIFGQLSDTIGSQES